MWLLISSMAGRKRWRCRPSLYRSSGGDVGGGDQGHAAAEQTLEQAGEDHGIGNVGDEELVQADYPRRFGQALRDGFERLSRVGRRRAAPHAPGA